MVVLHFHTFRFGPCLLSSSQSLQLRRKMSRRVDSDEPQFSGKSYLEGEPLPLEMSEGITEYHRKHRQFVKATKKSGVSISYIDPDLVTPEISAQMHSVPDFFTKRSVFSSPFLLQALTTYLPSVQLFTTDSPSYPYSTMI